MCFAEDCNSNGIEDTIDISTNGESTDCNSNNIPDDCDLLSGTSLDCNENWIPDECDIALGVSDDINTNSIPDECDPLGLRDVIDCNQNGIDDLCDIDCNASQCSGISGCGESTDCNYNSIPDECDIATEISSDCNQNGLPDECESAYRKLEIVLFFDTSGSMSEWSTISNLVDAGINIIENEGVQVELTKLTIAGSTYPQYGLNQTVDQFLATRPNVVYGDFLCAEPSSLHAESWAAATGAIAKHWVWEEGYARIIMPVSDEAACRGSIEQNSDDWEAIGYDERYPDAVFPDSAIAYCLENDVTAFPIIGNYLPDSFVTTKCANPLAEFTGGSVIPHNGSMANELARVLIQFFDSTQDCNGNSVWDICDVYDGTSQDCNSNQYPDECEDDCNGNNVPDDCDVVFGSYADSNNNLIPDECELRYVDRRANGIEDGLSWETAYRELHDALDTANEEQPWITELHVATGVYTPDSSTSDGDVTRAFLLRSDLIVLGGYQGVEGGANPDERNPELYPTHLSGTITGGQSLHVVFIPFAHDCILDGFVIENGNAIDDHIDTSEEGGGGFLALESDFLLNNIVFQNNFGEQGGALKIVGGTPQITNCVFTGNEAYAGGATMITEGATPEFRDCIWENNEAHTSHAMGGGAVKIDDAASVFYDSAFSSNFTDSSGGAIFAVGDLHLEGCSFVRNTGNSSGGAISCERPDNTVYPRGALTVRNCLFLGNKSLDSNQAAGGAITLWDGYGTIAGSLIIGNRSDYGGGISFAGASGTPSDTLTISHCTIVDNYATQRGGGVEGSGEAGTALNIYNSILWDNVANGWGTSGDQIGSYTQYSDLGLFVYNTDLFGGRGLIDSNFFYLVDDVTPLQSEWCDTASNPNSLGKNLDLEPAFLQNPYDGGDNWGDSNDDYGNLRLQANSPCIDTGRDDLIEPDVDFDLDENPRILGSATDMGAYEFNLCDPANPDWMDSTDPDDPDTDITLKDFYYFQQCIGPYPSQQCLDDFDVRLPTGIIDEQDMEVFVEQLELECPGESSGSVETFAATPMAMMTEVPDVPTEAASLPEVEAIDPWIYDAGAASAIVRPVSGGPATTTLMPHSTYSMQYASDYAGTDFVAVVYAGSSNQGLVNTQPAIRGAWSDGGDFVFLDLASQEDAPNPTYEDGFVRTHVVTNTIAAPGSDSGQLFTFTTGEPGRLQIHLELCSISEETMECTLSTVEFELIVEE